MSEETDNQVNQLVKEGVQAAKAGDHAMARGKLEAAVKIDPYNEQGWFWLARVVDTDEERRTCLGNVILINPGNERAQRMLDKLEGRSGGEEGGGGGGNRRLLILGAAGGGLLLLVVLFLVLSGGGGDDPVADDVPTLIPSETVSPTVDVPGTETQSALVTPTFSPEPSLPPATLPPTWTPIPSPTDPPAAADIAPPPPADLPGQILMQSGSIADPDNHVIALVRPSDVSSLSFLTDDVRRGQNPVFGPSQRRFAWAQFFSGGQNLVLQIQPFGTDDALNVASFYEEDTILLDPNQPTWAGNNIVFSAQSLGEENRSLWLVEVPDSAAPTPLPEFGVTLTPTRTPIPTLVPSATPEGFVAPEEPAAEQAVQPEPGSALSRLTPIEFAGEWPRFDPTGTAVVFVETRNGLVDLRVLNINDGVIFALTDDANAIVESAPDWGQYNGVNEIVFSGKLGSLDAAESDIYVMPADLSSPPQVLVDFGPNDIRPRFSPDGRYIVFASDIQSNWDTFIYDRETEMVYSVAAVPNRIEYPSDWAP